MEISPKAALRAIQNYDPARFYLIYSFKATLVITFNAFVAFWLFGMSGATLAVNVTMGIFFLANLETSDTKKIGFLLLYIAISAGFLPFVKPLMSLGNYLAIVVFVWVFIVAASSIYSDNLNKILLITNGTGLAGFVMQSNGTLELTNAIYGVLLGGVSAIVLKFGTFSKYGSFTKNSVKIIIKEMLTLTNALGSENFSQTNATSLARIRELKGFFNSDSINLKDTKLIRNHSRAIFYVYKLEEIALLLGSLQTHFKFINDTEILSKVKSELEQNFNELFKLFLGKTPEFKTTSLDELGSKYEIFSSSLQILYSRLELIKQSNDDKIELKSSKNLTIKEALAKINLSDTTTLNALRLSICMGAAILISQASNIDHGIWIALAVMSLNRNNRYMLKTAGRDNILGGLLGFGVGFAIVSYLPPVAIYALSAVGIFCMYYFKNFSQIAYAISFMAELTIIFSLLKNDFLQLIFYRLFDVGLGFLLVFAIYMLTLPKNRSELEARLKKICEKMAKFTSGVFENQENFSNLQDEIASELANFKELIQSEKDPKWLEIYNEFTLINLGLINLDSFVQSQKSTINISAKTDIDGIASRFEMLAKKLSDLPYYFISKSDEKPSSDGSLQLILRLLNAKQNDIYKLISH